ncbi:MAG: type I-F CRISPR-associated protein Csy3 [Rhodospirillales bacterium 20-64-7]|nr:MAG: type I-F CRISPR-associated protein Csy3 [Rhodospirillales bacterium 20-64-7]
MSDVTFKKLPGVLSFQRGFIISDGLFDNLFSDGFESPVDVVRHGIRGTQNINNDAVTEVSNIQTTETAKTDSKATGVKVSFGLRVLPVANTLFACAGENTQEIRLALDSFVEKALPSEGLQEVARRYARNLLNGRWLWRNRILGATITVTVSGEGIEPIVCDALQIPLQHFENYSEAEKTLGRMIAENMIGDTNRPLEVSAEIDFGFSGAVELFPSQNYVENKPKGFARPLYKVGHPSPASTKDSSLIQFTDSRVMGRAALRDQKIGNALRTIDTWYPSHAGVGKPIPVEPNGASLDAQLFFRREGSDKKYSAFELMKRINQINPDSPDGMFLIASLMRGGVFSESEKSEKAAKSSKAKADASTDGVNGDEA